MQIWVFCQFNIWKTFHYQKKKFKLNKKINPKLMIYRKMENHVACVAIKFNLSSEHLYGDVLFFPNQLTLYKDPNKNYIHIFVRKFFLLLKDTSVYILWLFNWSFSKKKKKTPSCNFKPITRLIFMIFFSYTSSIGHLN